jgi:hypothetical protein
VCGYCQEVGSNYGTQFLPQQSALSPDRCGVAGQLPAAAAAAAIPKPAPLSRKFGGGGVSSSATTTATAAPITTTGETYLGVCCFSCEPTCLLGGVRQP